jgi:hypothetical protein
VPPTRPTNKNGKRENHFSPDLNKREKKTTERSSDQSKAAGLIVEKVPRGGGSAHDDDGPGAGGIESSSITNLNVYPPRIDNDQPASIPTDVCFVSL